MNVTVKSSVKFSSTPVSSLNLAFNAVGSPVRPILSFTPATTVPHEQTITLGIPAGYFGYFIGTATFAATATNIPLLTGDTGSAAAVTASSTQIIITTAGAATGTAAVTITLSGLTLGAAQVAGSFSLSTSSDSVTTQIAAPLICSSVTLNIVTTASNISGAAVSPVLVYTPATTVPIAGKITLSMPTGYFIGTATFAATATNIPLLTGSAAAVTATSTHIIITTAGATTGTGSVTVTLSGLTLGPAPAAGICSLTTIADACTSLASQFALPAITPGNENVAQTVPSEASVPSQHPPSHSPLSNQIAQMCSIISRILC